MSENQDAVMPRPSGANCSTGMNKVFLVSYSSDICRDITMVNVPNAGPEVTCESIRQRAFLQRCIESAYDFVAASIMRPR